MALLPALMPARPFAQTERCGEDFGVLVKEDCGVQHRHSRNSFLTIRALAHRWRGSFSLSANHGSRCTEVVPRSYRVPRYWPRACSLVALQ